MDGSTHLRVPMSTQSFHLADLTNSVDVLNSQFSLFIRYVIWATVLAYPIYRCFIYFTSELPPFGSGLKRLPGPISTLPYLGRIHDVNRMAAWTAMIKFSDRYNGLFACTLGGETHIWVAREDIA